METNHESQSRIVSLEAELAAFRAKYERDMLALLEGGIPEDCRVMVPNHDTFVSLAASIAKLATEYKRLCRLLQ